MLSPNEKTEKMQALKREILALQGLVKTSGTSVVDMGFGPLQKAFPDQTFPLAAVHEFISYKKEEAAATNGFMAGVLGLLMRGGGTCIWVSTRRSIYPPALSLFGIRPEHIIFLDFTRDKDALWAIEEALKCNALTAVVGECKELDFTQSRRLQLAVEQSRVTAFIHRFYPKTENTVACTTRWKIKPITSLSVGNTPGVGFAHWQVELLKVRNGKPGTWQLSWHHGKFQTAYPLTAARGLASHTKTGTHGKAFCIDMV